jgi:muramoyltetrapeptide carboxypeptidase
LKTPEIGIAIVAPGGAAPDEAAWRAASPACRRKAPPSTITTTPSTPSSASAARMRAAWPSSTRRQADPDVQVVLALRGSYGISRLLPDIDFRAMAASRKLFVGYSDFTAFHMGLMAKTGRASFAGPMVCDDFTREEAEQFTLDQLWSCLAGPTHTVTGTSAGNPHVDVTGKLWGGNLAMLVHLLGTPYFPGRRRHPVPGRRQRAPVPGRAHAAAIAARGRARAPATGRAGRLFRV